MHWSIFGSKTADKILREEGDWIDLLNKIKNSGPHSAKSTCPWVKLARFGEVRSSHNSLRHDENVQEIYGIEGDYDGEVIQPEEAIARLEKANLKVAIYTSPSHTADKPRWRVLAPLSGKRPPHERAMLLARINGVLGGVLSGESFTLSQSYYFGRVGDGDTYRLLVSFDNPDDGICVDECTELDQIAIGKPSSASKVSGSKSTFSGERWSYAEMEDCVTALGRKLRTGDGRHNMLVRAANSLTATGVREVNTVMFVLDSLVQQFFDESDPPAEGALSSIASHAVDRDKRKEEQSAQMVGGLIASLRAKKQVDPETGEITNAPVDGIRSISDVAVWREDAQISIPEHLLNAPHPILEKVVSLLKRSAETTDVALCVSGAIHLACCTVARHVRSNKDNMAVLFLGNVARTGRGKNAAKNYVSKCLIKAFDMGAASDFTSSSSLFTLLRGTPSAVLHLDEFGDKLRHGLRDANGSPVVKGFSALKEIYSQCDDILSPSAFSLIQMSPKQRADFAKTNAPVQKPHLNILAVTTPGQLADAITDASVEGGLINRFLFVTASGLIIENEEFDSSPDQWLVDYMRSTVAELEAPLDGAKVGNLHGILDAMSGLAPSMAEFSFCSGSMALLNAFKEEIKELGRNDEFMADMSQRWRENAMRMALAVHSFCSPYIRTIDPSITTWCIDYCRFYGRKFSIHTLELAQPTEKYGQRRKAYLHAFRNHPEGINSDRLGKTAPWRHDAPNFRNALIADMVSSGEIARVTGNKPLRGPTPSVWVALQC